MTSNLPFVVTSSKGGATRENKIELKQAASPVLLSLGALDGGGA